MRPDAAGPRRVECIPGIRGLPTTLYEEKVVGGSGQSAYKFQLQQVRFAGQYKRKYVFEHPMREVFKCLNGSSGAVQTHRLNTV